MTRVSVNTIALLLFYCGAAISAPVELSPGVAESLLLSRPAPVYAELAQRARVQGTVKLLILVSENGLVTDVKLLSGHPLLNDGAVNSVRQSKYRSYSQKGAAMPFSAEVDITFLPGVSEKDYERDLKLAGPYFEQEVKCRDLVNESKWREAEAVCVANLGMVDKLGRHRALVKVRAYQIAASVMLSQDRYKEALNYLNRALGIGKADLNDDEVALGEVLVTLGFTYSKMGKFGNARKQFAKGEETLQLAYDKNSFFRARCLPQLKKALEYHILAAEADGAAKEAIALKNRLASLP